MGLDRIDVVDAASIDPSTGRAVLTMMDGWDWSDEVKHSKALDKLNAYLKFVQSGEIWTAFPKAAGRAVEILLVTRHPLPPEARAFLEYAERECDSGGIVFRRRHFAGSSERLSG